MEKMRTGRKFEGKVELNPNAKTMIHNKIRIRYDSKKVPLAELTNSRPFKGFGNTKYFELATMFKQKK
jgi:hypothetical protein